MREEQLRLRAERERERQEFERLEKERKAEEEGLFHFDIMKDFLVKFEIFPHFCFTSNTKSYGLHTQELFFSRQKGRRRTQKEGSYGCPLYFLRWLQITR